MVRRPQGNSRYGHGIEAWEDPRGEFNFGHRGTFANTSSIVLSIPQRGITVATCQTFDGSEKRSATDALAKAVLKEFLSVDPME